MINNLAILIISFFIFCKFAIADTFTFETKNIEILNEKNQILAGKGKVFSSDKNLEINADKFKYLKDLGILKSNGNGKAIIKSKNLIVNFDNAVFNQKNSTIEATGNIKVNQIGKNFIIETEKIFYNQLNDVINSTSKTFLKDNFQNEYVVDSFVFEINKNLLKVINLESTDKNNNIVKTEIAYINTLSGKLFGKDVEMSFNNSSFNKETNQD